MLALLPFWNASLNAGATILLLCGWICIKNGKRDWHRLCMASAFGCSVLFLCGYLYFHARAGAVHYRGGAPLVYFPILVSHTALAVLVPPLAIRTLYLASRERWEEHRRAARWTFPIWLYVSFTGVVVYEMLYRL